MERLFLLTGTYLLRALGFMSVWIAAASSVAVPPQVGLSAVTRAATASNTGLPTLGAPAKRYVPG